MSRHILEPREPNGYDIAVGWDSPSGTFFAQVITPDERLLVDLGHADDQIFIPGRVLGAVRPYAAIPVDLDNQLMREALDELAS